MFTVLVLDTNGPKEANLHLSEQQTDQLLSTSCLEKVVRDMPFGKLLYALKQEKGKLLTKSG